MRPPSRGRSSWASLAILLFQGRFGAAFRSGKESRSFAQGLTREISVAVPFGQLFSDGPDLLAVSGGRPSCLPKPVADRKVCPTNHSFSLLGNHNQRENERAARLAIERPAFRRVLLRQDLWQGRLTDPPGRALQVAGRYAGRRSRSSPPRNLERAPRQRG